MGRGGGAASGVGGGTFVAEYDNTALIVAGGGSYNSGTNQSNQGGLWESHGKCIITKL